ncbi:MAG: hypothetical protein ACSHX8_13145 [Opitutaceae bacterium]
MRTATTILSKWRHRLLFAGIILTAPANYAVSDDSVESKTSPHDHQRIQKNLARWHMGATLVLIKDEKFQRVQIPDVGYFEESIFLSDNSALTYKIDQGHHDFIIDLGQFMRVSRFFLNNQSAGGSFSLAASSTLEPIESNQWVKLTQKIKFNNGVIPSATFPEIETRYIHVRLNIANAGLIGNFGATGPSATAKAEFSLGKG